MRKTKIVCTLGPASRSPEMIQKLIESGLNVVRLNFSHGTHEYHKESIEMFRAVRDRMDVAAAVLLDTRGPEIRIGNFKNESEILEDGDAFTLTVKDIEGTKKCVTVTYKDLPAQLSKGNKVLLDDGNIELRVDSCKDTDINCTIIHGGKISNHKGVNIPCIKLQMPYMSEQDKEDVRFGIEQKVDFIAASFVRRKEDVIELRKYIDYHGGHDIKIISKIENTEGVDNFEEILAHSDGIMVARGDMGVEVEFERLPGIQKRFIKRCYQEGKMAITATQMLESMIEHPNPTRAEITDVANAVFDGTSAVMLSGETAMGKYPIQAVRAMAKIANQAEHDMFDMKLYADKRYEIDINATTPDAICDAACRAARDLHAKAIIAITRSGRTARIISKYRPQSPIIAATYSEKTFHQLALSWGVTPVLALFQNTANDLLRHGIDCAKKLDMVEDGDKVVVTAGVPVDTQGYTNLIKVEVVGSSSVGI
ncbi:MAG: pyruvate kinase [Lachnospiraceae bacterium]